MDKYNSHLHVSNHWHLPRALHNRYNDLVIADTLRLVALSMISLFVPIFLLKFGFTIWAVSIMELVMFIINIFLHYFVLKHISYWGIKKTMIMSYFFNIALYMVLFYIDELVPAIGGLFFMSLITIVNAFAMVFYWTAHHVYFIGVTEAKTDGEKLGFLLSVPTLFGVASPLLGSYLITKFSFQGAFLVSAILLILASYALFFSKNINITVRVRFKEIWDFSHMRKNIIFMIEGLHFFATGFIWPLFLFYMSVKIIAIGFLYFFSSIAYSIVSYIGGKVADKKGTRYICRIGYTGHSLSLVFRALSTTIFSMSIFQIMGGIFGSLLQVSLQAGFYKHSHEHIGNAIMNRELWMYAGRISLILIFLTVLNFFPIIDALIFVLILSGAIVMSLNFIISKDYSVVD